MSKEIKCSYCETFGEKPHCYNCKIFNTEVTNRGPREIPYSLEELIEYINNPENPLYDEIREGDFMFVELLSGEKIKIVIVGTDHDVLADSEQRARVTFAVYPIDGRWDMRSPNYLASKVRCDYLPRIFALMPSVLKDNIKKVKKHYYDNMVGESVYFSDNLWLFSEFELLGRQKYSAVAEGEHYQYFAPTSNRTFSGYVMTRSKAKGYTSYYCSILSRDATRTYIDGYASLLFGFCI